jgi:hypothetical protein
VPTTGIKRDGKMHRYSVHQTEKQDAGVSPDTSRRSDRNAESTRFKTQGSPKTNAAVLAKVILDIKIILEIEKALEDDLNFGKPRSSRPLHDQILQIMDKADAVGAAKRIQAGYTELCVVK